ncbi:MAG: zinc ribbon domain-containing protein [Sandaracinaceae bacterium]|nr:zinc ribbon domain-containing protein [Sandaracinaceae bacterium]
MPLFDFSCRECGHRFEELVSASSAPECPSCHSRELEKELGAFAVGSGAREVAPRACGSCGDPRGPGACRFDA